MRVYLELLYSSPVKIQCIVPLAHSGIKYRGDDQFMGLIFCKFQNLNFNKMYSTLYIHDVNS